MSSGLGLKDQAIDKAGPRDTEALGPRPSGSIGRGVEGMNKGGWAGGAIGKGVEVVDEGAIGPKASEGTKTAGEGTKRGTRGVMAGASAKMS
ncbi:unnamed protein product [Ilex paraguariensis]|uniref:Uncharacterized protein n=1 Tax=Ilex paraguariensis TaxID=185542 RepID=A0ABC8TSY1_9AQUA